MTARSTRQKIRDHATKAITHCENMMLQLIELDNLADHQSEYIEEHIPAIAESCSLLYVILTRFYQGL